MNLINNYCRIKSFSTEVTENKHWRKFPLLYTINYDNFICVICPFSEIQTRAYSLSNNFGSVLVTNLRLHAVLCGLKFLEPQVESSEDFGFRDAEAGRGGDIDGTILADGGMLATQTTHG